MFTCRILLGLVAMSLICSPVWAAPTFQDLPGVPLSRVREPLRQLENESGMAKIQQVKTPKQIIEKSVADKKRRTRRQEEPSSMLLSVAPGQNLVIPVAINHPNRILTPYSVAKVFTTRTDEIQTEEGIVYATPTDEGPLTMFITDRDGDQNISLSITLMPRAIPPREIKLTFAHPGSLAGMVSGNKKQAKRFERSNNHYDRINAVMLALAKQEIPSGYSLRAPKVSDPIISCDIPSAVTRTGQVFDGYSLSATVSVLTNISAKPIQIRESACWQEGVLGVATWPSVDYLQPGTSVELYVLFDKTEQIETKTKARPTLLHQNAGGVQ